MSPSVVVHVSRRAALGLLVAGFVSGCSSAVTGRATSAAGATVTGTWVLAITDLGGPDGAGADRPGTLEITSTSWTARTTNAPETGAPPDEWSGTWVLTDGGATVTVDQLDTAPGGRVTVTPAARGAAVLPSGPAQQSVVVLGIEARGDTPGAVLRVELDTARSFTVTYEEAGTPLLRFAGTRT